MHSDVLFSLFSTVPLLLPIRHKIASRILQVKSLNMDMSNTLTILDNLVQKLGFPWSKIPTLLKILFFLSSWSCFSKLLLCTSCHGRIMYLQYNKFDWCNHWENHTYISLLTKVSMVYGLCQSSGCATVYSNKRTKKKKNSGCDIYSKNLNHNQNKIIMMMINIKANIKLLSLIIY